MTHFTPWRFGLIFAASQERVAPRCQTPPAARDAAGGKNRPALRVGHIGAAGCVPALARHLGLGGPAGRRAPRPCMRFAPSGPGGPMRPMKWVNINDLWY